MADLAKIGDTVTCVEGRSGLTVGKQYLVQGVATGTDDEFYLVTGDNGVRHCKYYAHRFELYQSGCMEAAEEYEEAMLAQTIMDDLHG